MKNKGGALAFMYEPPPGLTASIGAPPVSGVGQQGDGGGGGAQPHEDEDDEKKKKERDSNSFEVKAINPLGLELRNVRCLKCRGWGHQMGDDECPMKVPMPFLSASLLDLHE